MAAISRRARWNDDEIGGMALLQRVGAVGQQRIGIAAQPLVADDRSAVATACSRVLLSRRVASNVRVSDATPRTAGRGPTDERGRSRNPSHVTPPRLAERRLATNSRMRVAPSRSAPSTSRTRCGGSPARRTPRPPSARRAPRRAAPGRIRRRSGCRPATAVAECPRTDRTRRPASRSGCADRAVSHSCRCVAPRVGTRSSIRDRACGPVSAATAAFCEIEVTFDVAWL